MKPEQTSKRNKSFVNWEALRARIEHAEKQIVEGKKLTAKEKQDLLKTRAQELASEPEKEKHSGERMEILTFRLASEIYGVSCDYVAESFHLKSLTPLPGTPVFLLGIVNFRGQIRSVLDIKKFFDLPDSGLSELNKVIILRNENMEFGILADEITGVCRIGKEELQEELPTLKEIRREYLLGITKDRLIILDGEKLLNDTKIVVNDTKFHDPAYDSIG